MPLGDCQFCRGDNFGWILFPGQFSEEKSHKKFKEGFRNDDHIVVNTTVPQCSDLRIFSITRKKEKIFEQNYR